MQSGAANPVDAALPIWGIPPRRVCRYQRSPDPHPGLAGPLRRDFGMTIDWQKIRSRFEAKFIPEPNSGCWLWTAAVTGSGYGCFWIAPRPISAHRASWLIYREHILADDWVLHRCDNPLCVNPHHLFLGDAAANVHDKFAKGREADTRGEENGRALLTNGNVFAILADPRPHREIAASYGISTGPVANIKAGKSWLHITKGQTDTRGVARGERVAGAKLSPELVRLIRADNRSQTKIARDFGICQMTVSLIKRHIVWGHVE